LTLDILLRAANGPRVPGSNAAFAAAEILLVGQPGLQRNVSEALTLFNKAAKGGHTEAQYMLGVFYGSGLYGVHQNVTLSILNFHFAARGGHVGAQMALGYRYKFGIDVPQSCKTAVRFYELAANQAVDGRLSADRPVLNEQVCNSEYASSLNVRIHAHLSFSSIFILFLALCCIYVCLPSAFVGWQAHFGNTYNLPGSPGANGAEEYKGEYKHGR
jgi:hypothetical protein